MSAGYPRPVNDPEALAASATLMGVVGTIALAASLGPMAGFEGLAGGAEVASNADLGIAAGGGITLPDGIELG